MRKPLPPNHRPLPLPEPRRKLTRIEFAQLMLDQKGRCRACGDKLKADEIIDEHIVPLDQCGSNDLHNRALFCTGCAREKTRHDWSASLHGRRVRGEIGQKRRRELRRIKPHKAPRTFPYNRDGRWKKKLDGRVVRRFKRKRVRPVVSFHAMRARGASAQTRETRLATPGQPSLT